MTVHSYYYSCCILSLQVELVRLISATSLVSSIIGLSGFMGAFALLFRGVERYLMPRCRRRARGDDGTGSNTSGTGSRNGSSNEGFHHDTRKVVPVDGALADHNPSAHEPSASLPPANTPPTTETMIANPISDAELAHLPVAASSRYSAQTRLRQKAGQNGGTVTAKSDVRASATEDDSPAESPASDSNNLLMHEAR
jgi:hypothetical protein